MLSFIIIIMRGKIHLIYILFFFPKCDPSDIRIKYLLCLCVSRNESWYLANLYTPFCRRVLKTSARIARKSDRKSLITGRNRVSAIFRMARFPAGLESFKSDRTDRICHQSDVDLRLGVMCIGSGVMGRCDTYYNRPNRSGPPPIRLLREEVTHTYIRPKPLGFPSKPMLI